MRRGLLFVLTGLVISGLVVSIAGATPGATLWSERDPGAAGQAVAASPDGTRVYVTATSGGSADDYITYAYNAASGFPLWSGSYSGPGLRNDRPAAIAVSPNGARVFVTGRSDSASSGSDYATVAYNAATGAALWSRRYAGPGEDAAKAIGVTKDGSKVLVTGSSDSTGASGIDYLTIAYDAATGTTLWRTRFDGPVHGEDDANSLALGPGGGRAFVTGRSAGSPPDTCGACYDYATVAYDTATGGLIWKRRYDGGSYDEAHAVAASPDSSKVFVTGQSNNGSPSSGGTDDDYVTIAYNAASGAPLWTQRFNGAANGTDGGRFVAVAKGSTRVVVTGIVDLATPPSSADFAYGTIAYDAVTGARLWAQTYHLHHSYGLQYPGSIPHGLALSVDGLYAYVTGTSYSGVPTLLDGPGNDWATLSYEIATGTQRWVRRFDGGVHASDEANGVAVKPTGPAVFVTGYGPTSGPAYPLLTIAYEG